jgi:HPt (histidine-containing phosphotransfer) domain-containing protein
MTAFEARLAGLRQRFAAAAAHQAAALQAALDTGDHARAVEVAHHLAGASGIFGYPALGDLASALETALEQNSEQDVIAKDGAKVLDALRQISSDQ